MDAWESFHKIECQQLDLITGANLGKNAMLAFRILTSSGKIYLEYVVNKVKEEMEKPENEGGGPEKVGFNEEGVYDAADYRTIYTLVGNTKHRGVGDLFKRGLMAAYMLKILELTPFFFNGGSDPRNVKLQDKVLVGGILLTHLQNLPCNAHEVAEIEIPSGSVKDSVQSEIGAASYGTLSLINHSCDPNVVRHYHSSMAVVTSVGTTIISYLHIINSCIPGADHLRGGGDPGQLRLPLRRDAAGGEAAETAESILLQLRVCVLQVPRAQPNIMLKLINKPPLQRQLASLHRSCHGRGAPGWHPT